jgi:hypothetical protein
MLPDFDRADAIGSYWGNPKTRTFAELLIHCEEDRTLRAVLVGMLTRGRPNLAMTRAHSRAPSRRSVTHVGTDIVEVRNDKAHDQEDGDRDNSRRIHPRDKQNGESKQDTSLGPTPSRSIHAVTLSPTSVSIGYDAGNLILR